MEEILHEVPVKTLTMAPLEDFEKKTPLLTAGDRARLNTMTIGWGGLGTLWGKPVCTVYVRPQRYTYGFMERSVYFTVSFFDADYRAALQLCGSKSGREVDKVGKCGFTTAYAAGDAPYFAQARRVLVCRKLYAADFREEQFADRALAAAVYPEKDYHRTYIGEIVQVLQK